MPGVPRPAAGSPAAVLQDFFRRCYPEIFRKVSLQVRRTPRQLTGPYRTNRESRWKLDPEHPDYTAAEQIPLIEAKLFAMSRHLTTTALYTRVDTSGLQALIRRCHPRERR